VDDGILSRDEKRAERIKWDALYGMYSDTIAKANAYGIVTERDSYSTAITALGNLLTSLSPAWDDVTQNTPITATAYRSNWIAAYQAEGLLLNRIAEESGKRATWMTVAGAGKPQDNATVGAVLGDGGNTTGQARTIDLVVESVNIPRSALATGPYATTVITVPPSVSQTSVAIIGAVTVPETGMQQTLTITDQLGVTTLLRSEMVSASVVPIMHRLDLTPGTWMVTYGSSGAQSRSAFVQATANLR
jgi:hypothetical protein